MPEKNQPMADGDEGEEPIVPAETIEAATEDAQEAEAAEDPNMKPGQPQAGRKKGRAA